MIKSLVNGPSLAALALILTHPDCAAEFTPSARTYAIPAGNLAEALTDFADQADLKLVINTELTRGIRAPALRGTVTAEEGLIRLLQGSGLGYRMIGDDTAIIESKPVEKAVEPQSAVTLPAVQVSGTAAYDPFDPYNTDYAAQNSSTATKTDTPIMETPVSIQVVPRAVMSDQKTTTIKDALENVSSVRPQSSLGLSNSFTIRGFRNGRIYRNGLVANGLSIGVGTQFETATWSASKC